MRQAKAQDKMNRDDSQHQSQVAYVKAVRRKSDFIQLMNCFEKESPATGSAGSYRPAFSRKRH